MGRGEDRNRPALVGLGFAWDEPEVGYRFRNVERTVTEADLVNFISMTGMLKVLFTDTEYLAQHGPMSGRVVPATLAYTFAERPSSSPQCSIRDSAFLHMEFDVSCVQPLASLNDSIIAAHARPEVMQEIVPRVGRPLDTERARSICRSPPMRLRAPRRSCRRATRRSPSHVSLRLRSYLLSIAFFGAAGSSVKALGA